MEKILNDIIGGKNHDKVQLQKIQTYIINRTDCANHYVDFFLFICNEFFVSKLL